MPNMKIQPSTSTMLTELLKLIERLEESQKGRAEREIETFNERLRCMDPNEPRAMVQMIKISKDIQESIVSNQKLMDDVAVITTKCRATILSLSRMMKNMQNVQVPAQSGNPTNGQKIKKRKSETESIILKRTKPDDNKEAPVMVIDEEVENTPGSSS